MQRTREKIGPDGTSNGREPLIAAVRRYAFRVTSMMIRRSLPLFGIAVSLPLFALAAATYPGGNDWDTTADGFRFTADYVCAHHGVLAPASAWRDLVVPTRAPVPAAHSHAASAPNLPTAPSTSARSHSRRSTWAEFLSNALEFTLEP